ncbi:beta-ketoacyl synthase N-terminal-like domain-containing protein, partial [Novosphingobium sediminicola]
MSAIYIVSGTRTAIGDFGGGLKSFMPSELAGLVAAEAVRRAGVAAGDVGHVVFGQVVPSSSKDAYVARVAALNAGIPVETPALTVNRLCGSGLQAIISAAQMMKLGEAEVTVAGGVESMSNAPYHDHGQRWGRKMGDATLVDAMVQALTDPVGG